MRSSVNTHPNVLVARPKLAKTQEHDNMLVTLKSFRHIGELRAASGQEVLNRSVLGRVIELFRAMVALNELKLRPACPS